MHKTDIYETSDLMISSHPLIYAIGDIHGQITQLDLLLERLSPRLREQDRLVFLGDYIDRGEDSCSVIERLTALKNQRPNTIFLRGNHENFFIKAYEGPLAVPSEEEGYVHHSDEMSHWLQNGGLETLLSYSVEKVTEWKEVIPQHHLNFIYSTEMEYIQGNFYFVHAGLLPPGKSWEGAAYGLDPRLWIREPFLSYTPILGERIVVFGHTPQLCGHPLSMRNKLGLDTGAAFGGPLSAAIFDPSAPLPSHSAPKYEIVQANYPLNMSQSGD